MKIKHLKFYSQNWLIILLLFCTISSVFTLKQTIKAQDFNCFGKSATILGTNQSDNLQGTAGNDVIVALGGNDRINGLDGDDIICGGNGSDEIHGGYGNDKIDSGKGNDTVFGESGNDIILGDFGTDTIHGGTGFDELNAGNGTDVCVNGDINKNCEVLKIENTPPVADAGADESVFAGDTVHLDGSGSSDVDGDTLSFSWSFSSKPRGSNSTLSNPSSLQPTFIVDKFGDYVLELKVNDGTVYSDPDTVTITTLNSPPVADAGPDQAISVPTTVQLNGSGSTDVDGNLLTFNWSLASIPQGSTAQLSDPNMVNPTFNADIPGTYLAQLIVNDGTVDGDPDAVIINTENLIPLANAGLDQTVLVTNTVQLDGSGSNDADNDPFTYLWSFVSVPMGSTTRIKNQTTVNPTFLVDAPGDYVVQLIVNDGTADSDPDTVLITTENSRPVAEAGADQTVPAGSQVQLDGTGSFDVDSDQLIFDWAFISIPPSSNVTLSDPSSSQPTFHVDRPGTYIPQLIVNDGTLDSDPDTVVITRENTAPVLNPVGNKTVALGSSLTFNLTASDPDNDEFVFSASPLPLPAGASLDSVTGKFIFTPSASQVGDIVITFSVSDGVQSDSETVAFTVTGIPPGGNTTLIGRVLDANDSSIGVTTPVVGASVSIIGTGMSALTDASGNFTLNNLPGGKQVFDINSSTANLAPDGSKYAGFREAIGLISGAVNNVERPFFLPRIDSASLTIVDPNSTAVVNNPNLDITITVPPNTAKNPDGTNFTGELSISLVPEGFAPAPLPEELEPGLLITIQPVGVSFSTPVPITFPNIDNLAPGSEVDIWSLDPDAGVFTVVGVGRVSTDGSVIETISGGIRAADWHAALPPAPTMEPPLAEPQCQSCCTVPTGSNTALSTGNLIEDHFLVSYRSLNQSRSLRFVYNSQFADPRPIITTESTILQRASVPQTASISISISGVAQGTEVYTDTTGLSGSVNEDFIQAIQFDATSFPTGVYRYEAKVSSNYSQSSISSIRFGEVQVTNQINSPFGSGWTLDGISRLYVQDNGNVLLIEGDGSSWHFLASGLTPPAADGASIGTALSFDGVNDRAKSTGNTFFMSMLPLTLEAWVRPELRTETTDFLPNVISNHIHSLSTNFGHAFGVNVGETVSNLRVEFNETPCCSDEIRTVPGLTFNPGEWHHIAVVYTIGNYKAYVDGELVDDFSYTQLSNSNGSSSFSIGDFCAGSCSSETRRYYKGLMDEICIWQSSRTQAEIQDNMLTQLTGNEPGLVWYSPLDEGSGQIINDLSISGINGVLGGGTDIEQQDAAWVTYSLNPVASGGQFVSPFGDFSTLFKNPDSTFTRTMKDGTEINFNAQGLQTSIVDRNGNTTTYTYDSNGLLASIADPVGMVTTLTYNSGNLSSVTDPAGRTTTFQHDSSGNLTKITDPDGTNRMFSYDSSHRMISQTSKRGFNTTYQYNFAGRNISALRPDGSNVQVSPSSTVGLGNISGVFGTQSNPAPIVRKNEVIATNTDGNGNTSSYKTNEFGAITEFTDAMGRTTTTTRDANNNIVQSIDPRGNVTNMTYDENGNLLTSTKQSIGGTTTITYTTDGFNQIKTITDPNNHTTTFNYDAKGNQTQVIDPLGNTTTNTYDGHGLLKTVTDALNNTVTYNYDQTHGNLIETVDQLNNETIFALDNAGNVVSSADALGRVTEFIYDSMNRLTTVSDPDLAQTTYGYDAIGNLISVIDARGNTTTFAYDPMNKVTRKTDPLGHSDKVVYEPGGRVKSTTDRNGQTITYQYDAANRLISKTFPGNQVATYSYDRSNNLLNVTDLDSKLTMTYDGANRLLSVSTAGSPSQPSVDINYTYDPAGYLLTMTDSLGGTTTYVYDNNNRLTKLTNPSSHTITFNYDGLNRSILRTYPNGVTSEYQYNQRGDLTRLTNMRGTDVISSFDYTYDEVGKRTSLSQVRNGVTVNNQLTYQYDNLDRLIRATNPLPANPDETFTYDPVGNRLTKAGQINPSVFDDGNRLLEDQNFSYAYDNNGNLIQKTDKNTLEVTQFTYDAENRLIQVDKGVVVTTYTYDGLGRRVAKSLDGPVTKYIYDNITSKIRIGSNFIFEFDENNKLKASYTHGLGADRPLIMERDGNINFYLTDGLGSITEIIDSSGVLVNIYNYDSFGQIQDQNINVVNAYTYTAREIDFENGFYYYRARYYDARIGRFLQEDPIEFKGGINFYNYVSNSPANYTDPLGLRLVFPFPGDNIPPPTIPLPDFGGCFGTLGFFNLSWISSEPTKTFVSLNGAALGGGILLCYRIKCDVCPGADPGSPEFGLGVNPFGGAFGFGAGISKDSICFAIGLFGSFTPFNINGPIGSF